MKKVVVGVLCAAGIFAALFFACKTVDWETSGHFEVSKEALPLQ